MTFFTLVELADGLVRVTPYVYISIDERLGSQLDLLKCNQLISSIMVFLSSFSEVGTYISSHHFFQYLEKQVKANFSFQRLYGVGATLTRGEKLSWIS
jgi:hypothetical protein